MRGYKKCLKIARQMNVVAIKNLPNEECLLTGSLDNEIYYTILNIKPTADEILEGFTHCLMRQMGYEK